MQSLQKEILQTVQINTRWRPGVRLEDKLSSLELTPPLSVSPPPKSSPSNSPVSCSTLLPPEKTPTRKQTSDIEKLHSTQVLNESPTQGVFVAQQKVEKLPKSTLKLFAFKLFELVFSREEAKMGSVEGKANKLCKLDPNWQQ